MVPLSGIGLSGIYRVFDVNVALCTTTATRRRPSALVEDGDVRWHEIGLGENLKNPSTSVHVYLHTEDEGFVF